MKISFIGAALAAATLAQAGAGDYDYLGTEPRQLGRRLQTKEDDTGYVYRQLEARASNSKAKAVAKVKAAKAKAAAAAAKSKAAAA